MQAMNVTCTDSEQLASTFDLSGIQHHGHEKYIANGKSMLMLTLHTNRCHGAWQSKPLVLN